MLAEDIVIGSIVSVNKEGSCLRKGARGEVMNVFNNGMVRLLILKTATAHVPAEYLSSRDFESAKECKAEGVHLASVSDVDQTCNHCFCH